MLGALSCGFCGCTVARADDADDDAFICTTIEPDPAPDLEIQDFSFDGAAPTLPTARNPFALTPFGTMFKSQRWHPGDGLNIGHGPIALGIELRTDDVALKAVVQRYACDWLTGDLKGIFELRFDQPREKCQIRVTFDPKGENSSEVGRQNLRVPSRLPTMNLARPIARGIRHEFGHALGLLHEHANPTNGIQWNKPVVEAELQNRAGWSKATVKRNLFDRYDASAACVGDPKFNPGSVMLYEIPARWTLNGFSSRLNTDISDRDRQCLIGTYRAR